MSYCGPEVIDGSCGAALEEGLELGEGHFDGIEVGTVGRQETQLGAGRLDGVGQIVGEIGEKEIYGSLLRRYEESSSCRWLMVESLLHRSSIRRDRVRYSAHSEARVGIIARESSLSEEYGEGSAPLFTTSLDASVPGERIILVRFHESSNKWVAIQRNADGSLHEGVGNTEPLARRIAALRGLQFANKICQPEARRSESSSEKYLRWKDDLRRLLDEQREAINGLIAAIGGADNSLVERPDAVAAQKNLLSSVVMMVQAVGISCNSIYLLSGGTEMTIRDCYSIARSIIETSVNVAFIQASGEQSAQRAHRHALQKYFRDLDRRTTFGNLNVSIQYGGKIEPTSIPHLTEALAEFTTKKGDEIRVWTPENIDQKIEKIGSTYGEDVGRGFGVGRFSIYRHSSEILHGTLFGVRYFWQPSLVVKPGQSMDEMIKHLFEHFFTVFNGVYFTVDALFAVFDMEYGLPEVRRARKALNERLCELEFIKDELMKTQEVQADTCT